MGATDAVEEGWAKLEKAYWENRYKLYTSGAGSVADERAWKWGVIEEFLKEVDHVIDVGCGDLLFWEGRNPVDYVGIDIAENRIEANKKLRPSWTFFVAPAERRIEGLVRPNVLCIDVLFHIMDTRGFVKILRNLCDYSSNMVFIHTWRNNPFFPGFTDGRYQYFRPLEKYMHVFKQQSFDLLAVRDNPLTTLGAMYVFRRSVYGF